MAKKPVKTELEDDEDDLDARPETGEGEGNGEGAGTLGGEGGAAEGEYVDLELEEDDAASHPKGEDGDTRLSVSHQTETPEERAERRRQEKRERRQRQRAARDRDQHELDTLRMSNEQLQQQLYGINQRLTGQDKARITAKKTELGQTVAEATRLMSKAIAAGDGEATAQAIEIRDNARDELRELTGFERAMEARESAASARPSPAGPSPAVQLRVEQFQKAHAWYDPRGKDEDSQLVIALDNQVMVAGYNPATKDYWDELERRVKRYLPHAGEDEDDEDDDDGARRPRAGAKPNGSRRGPQLGSGKTGGGPVKVFISPERKTAMIEAGIWDDPVKRKKQLIAYAKYDAAHQGKPAS